MSRDRYELGTLLGVRDTHAVAEAASLLELANVWDSQCTSAARSLLLVHSVVLVGTEAASYVPRVFAHQHLRSMMARNFVRPVVGAQRAVSQHIIVTRARFGGPQWILGTKEPSVVLAAWLLGEGALRPGVGVMTAPADLVTAVVDDDVIDTGPFQSEICSVMATLLSDGLDPLLVRRTAELL